MTIFAVICKTVDIQNNSQWPCSICPIPQFRLVGVRTSCISWTPEFWSPLQIPLGEEGFWLHPVIKVDGFRTSMVSS